MSRLGDVAYFFLAVRFSVMSYGDFCRSRCAANYAAMRGIVGGNCVTREKHALVDSRVRARTSTACGAFVLNRVHCGRQQLTRNVTLS
ncbi:hypothetical protein SAMN05192539_1018130 [Paraburkholderia diazotrophica]|uniref:Uncharacterized protein n=1 Tax=Paraburkholderia diazotrophica TaxID=667676 RepID=A0A1H7BQN5_9BURK|nr:hypothetical protein SAMN05192539_1018130 [Paraburkholderia diazotrophica]